MSRSTRIALAVVIAVLLLMVGSCALFASGEGEPADPEDIGITTSP